MSLVCPRCGSEKMMPNLPLGDSENGLVRVRVEGKRRSVGLDPVRASGPVMVDVCSECGHLEFKVQNPQDLYLAFRRIGN